MGEVALKTHLIVTDVHEEYTMNWCGKILNTKPIVKDGKPIFVIIGTRGRMEVNTLDMERLEKCAKLLIQPRGRSAITTDIARIYILEENYKQTLMGVLTHNHVKTFVPMYDKIECY